jgi:hypothetical protein
MIRTSRKDVYFMEQEGSESRADLPFRSTENGECTKNVSVSWGTGEAGDLRNLGHRSVGDLTIMIREYEDIRGVALRSLA